MGDLGADLRSKCGVQRVSSTGDLRVNVDTVWLKELYRDCFGELLFGQKDAFGKEKPSPCLQGQLDGVAYAAQEGRAECPRTPGKRIVVGTLMPVWIRILSDVI